MAIEDFFASLPRGKEDKPLLFSTGPLVYDFNDVDGLFFMLDRRLSGCFLMMWAKPMDGSVIGRVTLNGEEISGCVLQPMAVMGNMWILGIPLRGRVNEYGREYALHVEGYRDTDGNEMNPQDFTIKGIDRVEPQPRFALHEKIALEAAREGIVLLKNERKTLPLKPGTLNLFGRGVHEFRTGAVGAGKINPRYTVNFLEAVKESGDFALNGELVSFYSCDKDMIPPEDALKRAKKLSKTAIAFITRAAGENMDQSSSKGEYYLSDDEEALVKKLTETFERTVAILNVGYPIDVSWAEKYGVDALVYNGFGGMLAGRALLDVLSGAVTPSGKLPDTWARDYFDIPASRNFYDCVDKPRLHAECTEYVDTVYEEDIYVGYRYFDTFGVKPAYPFGFGLSYTEFMLEATEIIYDGRELKMKIFVKNMGGVSGKEVVQIYIGKPDTDLEKPKKELVCFKKTALLAPGEVEEIEVSVPKSRLAVYSEEKAAYVLEAGRYEIYAGNSSEATRFGSVSVSKSELIEEAKNRVRPPFSFTRLSKREAKESFPKGEKSGVVPGKTSFEPYAKRGVYPAEWTATAPENKITFDAVRNDPGLAESFIAQLSVYELARLSVCASAGWGMEGIGEAGSMFQIEGYDIPKFPVSDGNSGVNVNVKNIGMPSGATIAASWNTALCEEIGRVIGEEAKELGISMILAPGMNIHRNPLNGRQPEYFSEDPWLAGAMAGAYLRGLEGTGVAGSIKHFIANNCETSRKRNGSVVSERAIREIYLRAFRYAMEIHAPASVMTAYNAVNGVPTSADADLLIGILRGEWGYEGYVMTDWTSYDTVDVKRMVDAGVSWITPGTQDDTFVQPIVEGVESGEIDLNRLRKNVSYMIKTIARFS